MPVLYADIIVDIGAADLDRIFQYKIPDAMHGEIRIGMQVEIPFGKGNRIISGFIVNIGGKTDYDPDKIKEIVRIINSELAVESQLIRLAYKIKEAYGGTMIQALKTVVPVKKQIKAIETKFYRRIPGREEMQELYMISSRNKRNKAKSRLLEYLAEHEVISKAAATAHLNISKPTIDLLIKEGVIEEYIEADYRRPLKHIEYQAPIDSLNEEQRRVIAAINRHPGETHLIHGITGSGKTEIYMELIASVLDKGQQVIVLIPEISLTFQTVTRFYARFGERVSIMNSKLSQGERYDQYLRAKRGDVDVIIGPRSALFMPFVNLGMIIIDEEHDGAYKSESMPKYHARDVAAWRLAMTGGSLVLGSATPSVESYTKGLQGKYVLHRLTKRAKAESELAQVSVIDLREEFKMKNKKIFGRLLETKILEKLQKKEQIILFLNRRGYAGFISCRNCGHVLKCKHCDISLTAHNNGWLKCHYCGFEQEAVKECPECGSKYIAAFGTGTQKVERMVEEQFPQARVLRLDRDSTAKKDSMEAILQQFKNGEADILVGTQMIVKGHDFPNVTLVGILAADLSMFSNDYMAGERTFQLLTQAAGRAGRSDKPGEVIIQTYNPEHYSIVTAANQDYQAFYEQEIMYRRLMQYPPVVNILIESSDEVIALTEADFIVKAAQALIEKQAQKTQIIGPASAYISKGKDIYRKVIYMKDKDYQKLIEIKDSIELLIEPRKKERSVGVQFDFNPLTTY